MNLLIQTLNFLSFNLVCAIEFLNLFLSNLKCRENNIYIKFFFKLISLKLFMLFNLYSYRYIYIFFQFNIKVVFYAVG